MNPPPTCPRCSQVISSNDAVRLDEARLVHATCEVRRAREAREHATLLVKHSHELRDEADVLARQAEAVIQSLLRLIETTLSRLELGIRQVVRDRIVDGTLPRDVPPTIIGVPGDGSTCAACEKELSPQLIMMAISSPTGLTRLHGACYVLWKAERYSKAG